LNIEIAKTLDDLEHLRIYLGHIVPPAASIRVIVPNSHAATLAVMDANQIERLVIPESENLAWIPALVREKLPNDVAILAATALSNDVDCIVTDVTEWLPYLEDFEAIGVFLTTAGLLLTYCERFVRGHDVPWASNHKAWFEPWTAFYQLSEPETFRQGMALLELAGTKKAAAEAQEVGRSLVFNRLGDICFTRDRLLFYDMQQAVSKRARWKRQRFATEVAYHLNFYYLLLFGAFDHAAVFVNGLLHLGVKEKRVSARGKEFLEALKARSPSMHAVFVKKDHTDFIAKVAAVRHVAAHKGVITPTKVVEAPDHEPTNDELDEDIRIAGLDYIPQGVPPGPMRDGLLNMLRNNARMARYEQQTLMEDVVLVNIDGSWGWIKPLLDTTWNFHRCMDFLGDVFTECTAFLS
jgi:hypothetical protein